MNPQKGCLLIAEPSILNDDSFNRSIVLLAEHTNDSAVGFILNRPLKFTVKDLLPEIDCNFTVYQGGPVEQDNLYFVHKVPELLKDSIQIKEDLYWGGNFDNLKELLKGGKVKPNDIRFFLGYSGWGTNQLDDELRSNSWFISENDYLDLFGTDIESLWKNKLLQKGGKYKIWANAPADINLN